MSDDVVVTRAAINELRQNRNELRRAHRDAMAEADTLRQTVTNFAAINAERNAELEATRRQRDELLQALRALTSHKDSKLSTDVEYIGIHQRAQRILAQYAETTP